jgi:hypothetical protein
MKQLTESGTVNKHIGHEINSVVSYRRGVEHARIHFLEKTTAYRSSYFMKQLTESGTVIEISGMKPNSITFLSSRGGAVR